MKILLIESSYLGRIVIFVVQTCGEGAGVDISISLLLFIHPHGATKASMWHHLYFNINALCEQKMIWR